MNVASLTLERIEGSDDVALRIELQSGAILRVRLAHRIAVILFADLGALLTPEGRAE